MLLRTEEGSENIGGYLAPVVYGHVRGRLIGVVEE